MMLAPFDVSNIRIETDDLTCGHFVQNDRSRRVIEKIGFTFFGESEFETQRNTVEISRNHIIFNPCKER